IQALAIFHAGHERVRQCQKDGIYSEQCNRQICRLLQASAHLQKALYTNSGALENKKLTAMISSTSLASTRFRAAMPVMVDPCNRGARRDNTRPARSTKMPPIAAHSPVPT